MKNIMEVLMHFGDGIEESIVIYISAMFFSIFFLIDVLFRLKFYKKKKEKTINYIKAFIKKSQRFQYIIPRARMASISIRVLKKEQVKLQEKNKELYSFIDDAQKYEKINSIVEDIYFKKIGQYNKASLIICISIVIYFLNVFFTKNIKIEVLIFLDALICFIIILKLLISHRIEKEYYGTNYEESKEILYYITADSDKNDKNSGKKIFDDIDAYNKVKKYSGRW